LFARGVRSLQVNPGVTPEHWLGLFGVAIGNVSPDDAVLGRLTLLLGRRASQRLSASRMEATPPPASAVRPAPVVHMPAETVAPARTSSMFRPEVLPPDVAGRRTIAALQAATTRDEQLAALSQLRQMTPELLALRDVGALAEVVSGLDRALGQIQDPDIQEGIGEAAGALADEAIVERMVKRLGEPRVPPAERAHLVRAVGALGAVSAGLVLDSYLHAPAELREAYRAAIRAAGERAGEILQSRISSKVPEVVAAAAEFLGLSGNSQSAGALIELTRHADERVREAALLGLAELGGRDVSRPAIPSLKDESVLVRTAAARVIAAAGDAGATTVLVRRLEQEKDEGVLAALLNAIGQLGAHEALEVLAKFAEPGGKPRRTPFVRAAAIEGLARLSRPEAKALLELYARDKEPTVKRAAEASLK
jgi:HEAT repeat protein